MRTSGGNCHSDEEMKIRRVDYFYATVSQPPEEACGLLSRLAELGINLLAFNAVPTGPQRTQLTLFPEDSAKLRHEAVQSHLALDGPYPALLVQGDDELGALAGIHGRLQEAGVSVFASSGVSDGSGGYGYVVYVRPEEIRRARVNRARAIATTYAPPPATFLAAELLWGA